MYNYFPQSQTQQRPVGLKGRPVSSLDEVRAASIDFDGSVFYFPDLANRRIYTKQINLDGTATLLMYEMKEIPMETSSNSDNFITREEFENAIKELKQMVVPAPVPAPAPAPSIQF